VDYQGLRVLVTGADGFIGSHLTEKLVHQGAKVTALSLYKLIRPLRLAGRPARSNPCQSSR